jgi:hypothetical protein
VLFGIQSDHVPEFWPHAEKFILAACRKGPCGDLDADELRQACEAGRHQLWIAFGPDNKPASACVTGIRDDNGQRVAEWIAFGGADAAMLAYMPTIEEWAKQSGCSAFRSFGRVGMKKLMPTDYRVRGFIFEKAL